MSWSVFDGGARRNRMMQAEAEIRRAQSQVNAASDTIEDEVWTAYSNLNTAFRQHEAATALLDSATQSYAAAVESYNYGVRNLLDVTAAQKESSRPSPLGGHPGADAGTDYARGFGVPLQRFDRIERQETSAMTTNKRRRISECGLMLAVFFLTACGRAPSFDVLGSFFPAWLVCFAVSLVLTVAARWLLMRLHIVIALPVLTYPSLTALFSFALWLALFR